MGKKVLAVFYTQSGQLASIIDHFTRPLSDAGVSVEKVQVSPGTAYPFPWSGKSFFAVMPDSVNQVPGPLEPFSFKEASYDLIILGYQAWFLSPSIPANSLMNDPGFKAIAKNCPVITVTGARNMWISAMEKVKPVLKKSGAKLVGNIALVDRHANFVSFVTILYWMFTGKKDRYLNIFPVPGVSEEDIKNTGAFGEIVIPYLQNNNWQGLQEELVDAGAVRISYPLMFIESKARKIFKVWAGIISKRKKRTAWLVAFKYYLLIALFIAAPIILTVDAIFFKPFLSGRIKRQKQYYSGVN
ncbi:MAG: hypothetical protein Q8918_05625 [Bacteroidota bacterium]|nr:hypothetical protein [Bacteroidota bacterium]MDP4212925.1 hypothetical protein [Bacteroidota bacterium]MDP4249576.1 hypothetical protein [Bacteroidota bacterium]